MGYWKSNPPWIWIDEGLALFKANEFRIIDGGAAGELFEPFDAVSEFCEVVTFEPRGANAVEYRARVNINAGLWSEPSCLVLHVASDPSTSSIYPPNLSYLERFPARFGTESRRTAQRLDVPLTSIDAEVAKGTLSKPNFIKLDVHSAEYEAIVGCLGSLDECLGLLVETWHVPVHLGQHLNGEVEVMLQDNGFQLYDTKQASAWPHILDGESPMPGERRQLVGSESLFLREIPPPHLWAQYLALLELFGYATLAVRVCDDMLAGRLSSTAQAGQLEAVRVALLGNRDVRASLVNEELQKAKQARLAPLYRERQEAKKALQIVKQELELLRRERQGRKSK